MLRLLMRQIDDVSGPLGLRRMKACVHAAII
jgi:hypothetical protein